MPQAAPTGDASRVSVPNRHRPGRRAVAILLVDIAAPVVLYYVLHARGVDDVVALAAGAVPPAVSTAVTAIRNRRIEPVALVVLVTMALGLLASLVTGGPRELLVRGAWLSAPFGLWTLASLLRAKPICYLTTRALLAHRAEAMDERWETDPRFRRAWRAITVMWGVVMLADSGLRVLMAYTLPVPAVPVLDTALTVATLAVLQLPTHLLLHRSGAWDLLFRPHLARSAHT